MSNGLTTGVEHVELRQLLQELHSDILEDVDTKLQEGIDGIVRKLEFERKKPQNGFINKAPLPKISESSKDFPSKEFAIRDSALTKLWENPNVRSLYNCVLAFFGLLHIYMAIFYYFNIQRFEKDKATVVWACGKFSIVIVTWVAINLSIVFILHPVFRFWATTRIFAKNKGFYDSVFCILFILYEAALFVIPERIIFVYNLPIVSSLVLAIEQIRLFMKSYAFVRENITRALKYKPHQDGDNEESHSQPCPDVGKLVYFLFAPTLIYRDSYPRTTHIRWRYAAWNLLQTVTGWLSYYISFVWFASNTFDKAGIEPIPFIDFVGMLSESIFAGAITMFMGFFATIHCWPNAFAEILRFGDRMFYDDWWNCTSYAKFYRSWNMLVHDWLYSYIYRDMYVVLGRSKIGAMLSVFMLSAIVHEYIFIMTLKFLFPLMFTLFTTFGVLLVFVTRRQTSGFWNVFLWGSMFQGYGLFVIFYTLEWYARTNCPRILDSWLDHIVPRSFQCHIITFSS